MPYRWKNKMEVDEAVVVVMNSINDEGIMSDWLVRTLRESIKDSEAGLGTYFLKEIRSHAPEAFKYFESRII